MAFDPEYDPITPGTQQTENPARTGQTESDEEKEKEPYAWQGGEYKDASSSGVIHKKILSKKRIIIAIASIVVVLIVIIGFSVSAEH